MDPSIRSAIAPVALHRASLHATLHASAVGCRRAQRGAGTTLATFLLAVAALQPSGHAQAQAGFAEPGDALLLPLAPLPRRPVAPILEPLMHRAMPQARPLADRSDERHFLVAAVASGELGRVRDLLQAGVAADARDADGRTALAVAVRAGHVAIARLLLARGANPRLRGWYGLAPLSLAVLLDHEELTELLLRRGADPNEADGSGHTPLTLSAHLDRPAPIAPLIAAGARPDLAGRHGPPLVVCSEADAVRACRRLLALGADPNVRDASNRSPLLIASINESRPLARALLDAGADPGTIVLDWLDR